MASRLSVFLAELRRRKVGRVAVVYALVGVGAVEAADLFLTRLLAQAHHEGLRYSVDLHRDTDLESLRGFAPYEEFTRPRQ